MLGWWAIALVMLSWPARDAQADDTLRVLVRVASDQDRALLPRLYGQLSDVQVTLLRVDTAPLEATFAQQLEAANDFAAKQAADAVLWFSPAQDGGMVMYVITVRDQRVLTRRLLASAGALDGKSASSLLETVALAARSALGALSAGNSVGVPIAPASSDDAEQTACSDDASCGVSVAEEPQASTVSAVAAPASTADPARSPQQPAPPPSAARDTRVEAPPSTTTVIEPDVDDSVATEPEPSAPRALDIQMSVGVQGTLDGRSSFGQHGLYARAGLGLHPFVISVYGAASLSSTIEDPYFRLRVARHALGMAFELQSALGDATKVGLAVHAGAALLERSSQAKSADAVGYPPSLTAAFAFGPELALRWLFGHYGLGLRLGLDILPSAPRFETAPAPQGSALSHSLWALQPRLALGMEVALP